MGKVGSRAQVFHGTVMKTSGGLKKSDLKKNKFGRIVSRKQSALAKKRYNSSSALREILKQGRAKGMPKLMAKRRRSASAKKRKSPAKRRKSPAKRKSAPAKRRKSPVRKRKSPVRKRKSPVRKRKSPARRRSTKKPNSPGPRKVGRPKNSPRPGWTRRCHSISIHAWLENDSK